MTIETTPDKYTQVFETRERARFKHLDAAVERAAVAGAPVIREKEPHDLGGLRRHTETVLGRSGDIIAKIVEDTPYAASIEAGTRPFTPPLGPLIAWAIRKMGGITNSFVNPSGAITQKQFAAYPLAIAVRKSIMTRGIKAQWFTRDSLPALRTILATQLSDAVRSFESK